MFYVERRKTMKNLKLKTILMMALLLAVTITGCAVTESNPAPGTSPNVTATSAPTASPTPTAIVVTDMKDREVTLDKPAERIVALTAADCEILYAVGAGNTLVGRGEFCDYPADVTAVPSVQSGSSTNVEQIIALNPQVVLMSTMAQTKEQVAALEAAGIKVIASEAHDIQGVYTAIDLIGTITGKKDEATKLINNMKTVFTEISANAEGKGGKTVYFEVSPLEWGLWTAGKGTFMNELADMLGLVNIFSEVDGWAEISQEQVIERDPDYIVTITMYFGEGPTPVEEIMSRKGWQDMKAIRNGGVYHANSDEISRPGPRLADAIQSFYRFVYEGTEPVE